MFSSGLTQDGELLAKLNRSIARLDASGKIDEIFNKYGLTRER